MAANVMVWDCRHNTAIHLAGLGRTDESISQFDAVSVWHPDGLHARYLAANLTADEGDLEGALARYSILDDLARHYRRTDYRKAAIYAKLRRRPEAEKSLLAYTRYNDNDKEAYRLLVDVSIHLKKQDQAHEAALQLVRIAPDDSKNWFLLSELYKQKGDYKMARKMLDRAEKVRDYAGSKTSAADTPL